MMATKSRKKQPTLHTRRLSAIRSNRHGLTRKRVKGQRHRFARIVWYLFWTATSLYLIIGCMFFLSGPVRIRRPGGNRHRHRGGIVSPEVFSLQQMVKREPWISLEDADTPFNRTKFDTIRRRDEDARAARSGACATHPRLITIRGERNSGTNWIREVININAGHNLLWKVDEEAGVDADGVYGWKHGFLRPTEDRLQRGDILLILTRDVFSWLVSMYRRSYTRGMDQKHMTFSQFIRSPYAYPCIMPKYYKGCQRPLERAKNFVQLRTAKYKNWLSNLEGAEYSLLRYESVLSDGQEQTIREIFARHCVPLDQTKAFEEVNGYTKHHEVRQTNTTFAPKSTKWILSKYSIDDLRFVLDNVDIDFEANVLNYTYQYVNDYIEKHSSLAGALHPFVGGGSRTNLRGLPK